MKDPAMLFYTSDFLTGVALMDMRERGQYITLLCLQQQRGHMTEKEMIRAVGKMSPELRSKFVMDEEGKLYNVRADIEIKKREAHSKKQTENINRRWNKPNTSTGTQKGNTTVLPLENEDEIEKSSKGIGLEIEEDRGSGGKEPKEAGLGEVMTLYYDKINAQPSGGTEEMLKAYVEDLSAEVVLHALNIALDEKKTSWSYIKAILQRYSREGITSLEAARKSEQEFEARKQSVSPGKYGAEKTPKNINATDEDLKRMRETLRRIQEEG